MARDLSRPTLETTFHEAREYYDLYKNPSEVGMYLEQLDELENFIEREEYDYEQIRTDEDIRTDLRDDFLKRQEWFAVAAAVLDKIESLILDDDGVSMPSASGRYQYKTDSDLVVAPIFRRYELFESMLLTNAMMLSPSVTLKFLR